MRFTNTFRSFAMPIALVAVACTSTPEALPTTHDEVAPSAAASAVDGNAETLGRMARERATVQLGTRREGLELIAARTERLPWSGQVRYRHVFHSRDTGGIVNVDLDADGRELDDQQVSEAERLAKWNRFGHLTPALSNRVEGMSDADASWVVLYLPVAEPPRSTSFELARELRQVFAEQEWTRRESQKALARLVAALSPFEYVAAADGSPWLRARLTGAKLRTLARSDLVGAIFDAEEPSREALTNANHYTLSLISSAHAAGLLGSGVRVATLLETVPPNANLPFDPYGTRAMYPLKSPCNEQCDVHGANVMGYIQNTNPDDPETPALTGTGGKKGVAPLVELYSGNNTEIVGTLVRAEQFTPALGNGSHTWTSTTATNSYSTNVWRALPDNGTQYDTAAYASAPRLDYTMNFPITGKYYIWVRGKCSSSGCTTGNTVHVGLDGVVTTTSDRMAGYTLGFNWKSVSYQSPDRPYFTVSSAGPHRVSVWMRDDGFFFDALMITPVDSFVPTSDPQNQYFSFARDPGGTAMDQYSWLATKNVLVVNLSAGKVCGDTNCSAQDIREQIADYYATHAPYMLSVYAGGNFGGTGTNGKIVANFLYNGLVVGGARPKCYYDPTPCTNGWQSTDRTLDHTYYDYVYQNPPIGSDWELPHMVAYAGGLHGSLNASQEESGTSYAAPQVAGTAALVIGGNSALQGRPETVKAILMAGADVNTDRNSPWLGAAYSYIPAYSVLPMWGGVDRHGGVGLLNAAASAEIGKASRRIARDNRTGVAFAYALGGASSNISTYQAGITPSQAPLSANLTAGSHGGYDMGSMDPNNDFDGIWYKHYYYFTPTVSGTLRIVVAWNRPFSCSGTPLTCSSDSHPELTTIVRDLDYPTSAVTTGTIWEPNETFMAAPVEAGKTYRLDMYKQNYWSANVAYGVAAYLTANPQ